MELKDLDKLPPWEWPQDAARTLLRVIGDQGAPSSDRLLAARLAGDVTVMCDELAEALLAIAGDRAAQPELRGAAAIALGPALECMDLSAGDDSGDGPLSERTFRSLQRSLHKLFMDADVPADVRRPILEASVRAPEDWHQGVSGILCRARRFSQPRRKPQCQDEAKYARTRTWRSLEARRADATSCWMSCSRSTVARPV